MNIWITGCAGFLGKRLARHFKSSGHRVIGFSRRESDGADNSVKTDLSKPESITTIRMTATELGPPDVVIHAASKQPGQGTLAEFVLANVHTASNLLDGLKPTPPKQIIYPSTLSVYPAGIPLPAKENAPPVASSPYAATKRWAEEVMQSWKESQVTVLRLPSLYGVGQADSFIDGLAKLALKNERIELFSRGTLIREALHVNDIVSAIQGCIDKPPTNQFSLLNLGCGRAISTMEFAETLKAALGSESQLSAVDRKASQHDLWADISLAQLTIGFAPTELRESMRIYVEELRA